LDFNDHELSLVIMDDAGIRELNSTYRGMDKPTNVLCFSMQEGQFSQITPGLLGDVVISLETAKREASEAGIFLEERVSQLLIHGILHLAGLDHEQGETQAMEMEAKSLDILRQIEPNTDLTAF
jgi:probable rRNA maturation factor